MDARSKKAGDDEADDDDGGSNSSGSTTLSATSTCDNNNFSADEANAASGGLQVSCPHSTQVGSNWFKTATKPAEKIQFPLSIFIRL